MKPRLRRPGRRVPAIPSGVFRRRRYLLSRNEAAFLRALLPLVGGRYLVSCKVRLADLVTCSSRDWDRGAANRISQKHVDFVVSCPDSSRVVLAIELDDRSHLLPERRRRDQFVNRLCRQMGVPLARVPARWQYSPAWVASQLSGAGLQLEDGD